MSSPLRRMVSGAAPTAGPAGASAVGGLPLFASQGQVLHGEVVQRVEEEETGTPAGPNRC